MPFKFKLSCVLFSSLFHLTFCQAGSITNTHPIPLVAHAGGGYKNQTYTDSIEALDSNANAYDLFEIDFNFTSDKKLVCIHDWDNDAPTYSDFLIKVKANPKYTNCTMDSLAIWLKKNPTKKIVTDVKDNNIEALTYIKRNYPDLYNRFIPQIYNPNEYKIVKDLGYSDIILTLYMWDASDDQVIDYLTKSHHAYYAITIWDQRSIKLAPRVNMLGIPVFAHTVNDKTEYENLLNFGVTNIYTDWLTENLAY